MNFSNNLIFKSIIILLYGCFNKLNCQNDTLKKITYSAFVDAFYVYDFAEPKTTKRNSNFYNYNRHNQVNINLAYLKANYTNKKVHANIALAAGTYIQDNLSTEPTLLQNIFEANLGFNVYKNWWFEMGVFPSHIGFESAVSKDCWNLTRSICAENTPYYESGAKLNYISKNQKWLFSGMYLNGWQRIQKNPGYSFPSFGTQITFKPSSNATINHSTFIGYINPDSLAVLRLYNNLYFVYQITEKVGMIMGFDYGQQQHSKKDPKLNFWYSNVVIFQYKINKKTAFSFRSEYYSDPDQVIINSPNGEFSVFGNSLNVDFIPQENFLIRIEGRYLKANDDIFLSPIKGYKNNNTFLSTSVSYQF